MKPEAYIKNCTKINQITTMVWLLTQSQTFWSVMSSRPEEALLSTKLVDEMGFQ